MPHPTVVLDTALSSEIEQGDRMSVDTIPSRTQPTSSNDPPALYTESKIHRDQRDNTSSSASASKPQASLKFDRPRSEASSLSMSIGEGTPDIDYANFVKSLGLLDDWSVSVKTEDDDDFDFAPLEDSDSEDDEQEGAKEEKSSETSSPSTDDASTFELPGDSDDTAFLLELEAELGSLVEEDMEAAVTTLLSTSQAQSPVKKETASSSGSGSNLGTGSGSQVQRTPLREASRAKQSRVSSQQMQKLQELMKGHYQLLVQQAIMSIRAASAQRKPRTDDFVTQESPEDLAEILDGAVGMLQDLDQQRKDAIRTSIQLVPDQMKDLFSSRRSLLPQLSNEDSSNGERRLTRAAFSRTLQHSSGKATHTVFDIKGLQKLGETFRIMDRANDVLDPSDNATACRFLLEKANAEVSDDLIPGTQDVAELLSDPKEVFGATSTLPTTPSNVMNLRRDRNQFTAAEDNLVLRGVNLYGEKQWLLIADRFLPDRSVNLIAQRYSKLSIMLFRAHGIQINADGTLITPPRFDSIDKVNPVELAKLKRVKPPAILNVHRWSIEEDLTLLKAVPIMGNMWAELSSALIPHRDRGHLRKRYQVLERRVKATVNRTEKEHLKAPKSVSSYPRAYGQASKRISPTSTGNKATIAGRKRPLPRQTNARATATSSNTNSKTQKSTSRDDRPARNGNKRGRYTLPIRNSAPLHPGQQTSVQRTHSADVDAPDFSRTESSSRAGFEKLLTETSNDWSQLARVRKMMENDTESMVADAIVNSLAKDLPPGCQSPRVDRMPSMTLDAASSSGFSYLEPIEDGSNHATPVKKRGSILSSVMDNVSKKSKDESSMMAAPAQSTPSKSSGRPPSTPSKDPSTPGNGSYSALGGCSMTPVFRSSPSSRMPVGFSPAGPNRMGPGYSPSIFQMGLNNGTSFDYGTELGEFEVSQQSHQPIDQGGRTPNRVVPIPAGGSSLSVSAASRVFRSEHQIMADDLAAITALSELSNSPARLHSMPPKTNARREKNEDDPTKKSLFASVVGKVDKKKKTKGKKKGSGKKTT